MLIVAMRHIKCATVPFLKKFIKKNPNGIYGHQRTNKFYEHKRASLGMKNITEMYCMYLQWAP
jgi:hypothetical protein